LFSVIAGLSVGLREAGATWSIIIIDVRTGEVAAASATCLTGFDLQANTPVMLTGVGAATAQSFVDSTGQNRTYIRDRLLAGDTMDAILAGLAVRDSGHQTRQYGIADVRGGTLTFSGTGAGLWAGGRTGRVGDLVYAVQGNVLTGPPVVDLAVAAIETTPGDIAAKLMAGMEAARLMGGDGRCSCSPNDADGCGSPPPSFVKSADIAYMLIARAGDVWSCRAAYRTQSGATGLVVFDADGDAKPEVYMGAVGTPPGLLTLTNTSSPNTIRFADPAFSPGGGALRGLVAVDADRDLRTDLVGTLGATDRVVYLRRNPGDGVPAFSTAGVFAVGDNPGPIVAADLDGTGGPDLVTLNLGSSDVSVLLGAGDGTFAAQFRFSIPATALALAAGDVNGDGAIDIVTLHGGNARAVQVLLGNGQGGFTAQTARSSLPFVPSALLVRDVTGDGRADLVYGGATSVVVARELSNPALDVTLSVPGTLTAIDATDMDGDGVVDLVAAGSGSRLSVLRGLGGGAFATGVQWVTGFAPGRIAARDFDADGDVDAVYTNGGSVITMTNVAGPGRMPEFENAGCASGSGFMEFNVANQSRSDPDPVLQLRGLYDSWRQGLVGVPDAVQSTAEWVPRGQVPADGHAERVLRVTLRDWSGAVPQGPLAVSAIRVGGTGGAASAVLGVNQVGQGVYDLTVRAGRGCGDAVFEARVQAAGRTIILMPSPVLVHTSAADANDDGFVDFFDYDRFVADYEAGLPSADLSGDGTVTREDYDLFVGGFEEGC
jgi:hypothetical protein